MLVGHRVSGKAVPPPVKEERGNQAKKEARKKPTSPEPFQADVQRELPQEDDWNTIIMTGLQKNPQLL